jgi:hypothetical protein
MSVNVVRAEFRFLFESKVPNIVVAAARGTGKTFAAVQYGVFFLLSGRPNASVVFFSATLGQAKDTVREPMQEIMRGYPEGFCHYNKAEHTYAFTLGPYDVREFRIRGYEGGENRRGLHPDLIILDECASMPTGMLGSVIIPMLAPIPEKGLESGRLIAIGTARGKNTFYDLWLRGKDKDFPDWESYTVKADDSRVFGKEFLMQRRLAMTKAEYSQEYECDFLANVFYGSVYADSINRYTMNNIDDSFDYDPSLPVWTCWDLGYTDYTSIWFFQVKNSWVTFIDYMEDNGHTVEHYADLLFKKPYQYAPCILPFDGFRHDMRGPAISEQLAAFGFRTEMFKSATEQYGIDKARSLLKVCRFNKSKCAVGLDHLKAFHYKINSKTGDKCSNTEHDVHSHAADAFRYVAMSNEVWGYCQQTFNEIDKDAPRLQQYSIWE